MARQYQIPGADYVDDGSTRQFQIPGSDYVNATGSVAVAFPLAVGAASGGSGGGTQGTYINPGIGSSG